MRPPFFSLGARCVAIIVVVASDCLMRARETFPYQWRMAVQSLNRPYPVSIGMVALVSRLPATGLRTR